MPDSACPKCDTPRHDAAAACSRCGLAAARMESYAKETEAAIPDVLTAAWDRAAEAWDDPARHDEVIRLVSQHDAFTWAAARYRTRAGDPIGDRQLARIRKAAEATLYASATMRKDNAPKPYRALVSVLIMLIVAAIAGLLFVMVMRDNNVEADKPNATPAVPVQRVAPPSIAPN